MSLMSHLFRYDINFLHPKPGNALDNAGHSVIGVLARVEQIAQPTLEQQIFDLLDAKLAGVTNHAITQGVSPDLAVFAALAASNTGKTEISNALKDAGWVADAPAAQPAPQPPAPPNPQAAPGTPQAASLAQMGPIVTPPPPLVDTQAETPAEEATETPAQEQAETLPLGPSMGSGQ